MIPFIQSIKTGKTNLSIRSSDQRGAKGATFAGHALFLELHAAYTGYQFVKIHQVVHLC